MDLIVMNYKAVIFDLDGTLLNSLEDIADSANSVLLNHDLPTHKPDDYKIFVGSGISELMSRALPEKEKDPDTIDDYVKEFREEYARNWNVKTEPYAGIAAMLDELVSRKIKIAVLSNKLHAFTKQLNIDPLHILYVGDSDIDMKTALAACMHPVGVLWGFRTKKELQKNGAKTLIEKPQELLDLIE